MEFTGIKIDSYISGNKNRREVSGIEMKIAMMTNNYKPFVGGVPISIERLTEGLRSLGHEVCVFAPEYEEVCDGWQPYEEDVIRYGRGKKHMENGMVIPNVLDERIREEFDYRQFDLIHVHQPMLVGNIAQHYSRKYNIPLAFTWHTRYEEYLHYLSPFSNIKESQKVKQFLYHKCRKGLPYYMKAFANRCDLIYAPCGEMELYLKKQKIKPEVRVLPTGLSDSSFVEEKKCSAEIRRELLGEDKKTDKKLLFCTVSRLEKEKNLYFLLDAAKELRNHLGDTFRFVIVGEGGERKALMSYAKERGLGSTVQFVGGVPNEMVKNYLFASDIFLFSSKSETQGIVLAEAMAAGLPVSAVRACGVNDIVKDGVNGNLSNECLEEYVKGTVHMAKNEFYRKALGTGARKTAKQYDCKAVARQAEAGYISICKERERSVQYGRILYG